MYSRVERVMSLVTPARVVVLAVLAAAALTSWDLGARSLWYDEAVSVEIAGGTTAHLWQRVSSAEPSMGLYYALLHPWLALGRDEGMVRALSALLVVATVPLTYLVGVRLIGAPAAALGALLLATNAFVLRYGQEARSYALASFLVVASALALLRALERSTLSRWAMWAVTGALATSAHTLAFLAVGAQLLAVVRRVPPRTFVLAISGLGALVAPILWLVVARDVGQVAWIARPDVATVLAVMGRLTGTDGRLGIAAYGVCVAAALWRGGFGVGLLLSWAVLPFVATLALSAIKPLFLDRYFLVLVPAAALLAGAGVMAVRAPRPRAILALAFVALQVVHIPRALPTPVAEDWRAAAAIVRADARPGDAAACWWEAACVSFDYYFAPARGGGPPIIPLARAVESPALMTAFTAAHSRIWLAVSHASPSMPERYAMLQRIESALAGSYALIDTHELPGVVLRRYERTR